MPSRPRPRTIAVTLSTLLLPLSILAGAVAGAYYKSTNPNNIDITTSLAYLQQTLFIGIGVGILIGLSVVGLIVHMYKKDRGFVQAKLPLTLLVAVGLIVGLISLSSSFISRAEDQYRIDHGQPTLQQFFDKLESDKNR